MKCLIRVQMSKSVISGWSSESVQIDFSSETVAFARSRGDGLSQDSKGCSSDGSLLGQKLLKEEEKLLSASHPSFSALRKFWDSERGGETLIRLMLKKAFLLMKHRLQNKCQSFFRIGRVVKRDAEHPWRHARHFRRRRF